MPRMFRSRKDSGRRSEVKKTESIIFAQPFENPVQGNWAIEQSIHIPCLIHGIIGTPTGAWADIEIDGERNLVHAYTVYAS